MNPPDLPLVPPQPPAVPPPRKGMSTVAIVLTVVGVVVVVIAVLAALAVPAFQKIQAKAQEARQQRESVLEPPAPLTAQQKKELQAFGDKVAAALTAEDDATVKSVLDSERLADRVFDSRTAGFPQSGEMRRGFISGAVKHPGGWLRNLMGAKVKALRCHERDGFPVVLLRMMPQDGGVNYVDLVVRPDGGSFRAVDLFTYMYASYFSDETRNLLALMVPSSSAGKMAAWLGAANFDNGMVERLKEAGDAMRTGNFTEVLRICDSVPEKYRTHRMFFMMRLQAHMAMNGGEDGKNDVGYREMLRSAPDILGKDSTTDLLMIDLHFLDNQLAEADASIERVDKIIGGDPYLKVLRANTRCMMKDYEGAIKLANEAQQEEPDLYEAVDSRLTIRLAQKNFPALVEELRAFRRASGVTLGRESLAKEAQYTEFLASPEFAAWEKEIAAP